MGGVMSLNSSSVEAALASTSVYEKSQLVRLWALIDGGTKVELGALAAQRFDPATVPVLFVVVGFTVLVGIIFGLLFLRRPRSGGKDVAVKAKNFTIEVPKAVGGDEESEKKKVSVFFGTQTGTAERFAQLVAEEGNVRYTGKAAFKAIDLDNYATGDDEYKEKLSQERLAIFTLATYGDGEPTDNAATFYKWIEKVGSKEDRFSELTYAVFGLVNRQYEYFNKVGLAVDDILTNQGAKGMLPCGLGDDDKAIEDDFTACYEAADHVGVYAENTPETVETETKLLGHPPDMIISVHKETETGEPVPGAASLPTPFPSPSTLQTALARYADLLNPPRKGSLSALAAYVSDSKEAERLKYLSSQEGKQSVTGSEAESILKKLQMEGRYLRDVW